MNDVRPIDANALVEKLVDWRGDIEDVDENNAHDVAYYSAMGRAIRFAKYAPTLDYAPVVHGYWKHEEPVKDDGQKPFVCSTCGLRHPRYGDVDKAYFSYCPWCGAQMDAEMDGGLLHAPTAVL